MARFVVYEEQSTDPNVPDLDEIVFNVEDSHKTFYIKIGNNLMAHDKGDIIHIDQRDYEVSRATVYNYSRRAHGDYELDSVNVWLKEV